MTKTLEEKISGLSPERQQKIQDMTSQLIAEEQTKMTTPSERINSIAYTEQFLLDLIVKECLELGKELQTQDITNGSDDYKSGREMGIEVFMNQIKKNFGIE